jgi:glycosyltransferase involved in cell wall biosynthesis
MNNLIKNLKKLDKFIVLTETDRKSWKEIQNVSVIPNPLSTFPNVTSSLTNKQVIAVGRYAYEKGFEMLIDSWNIVHKKHPEWILKIYGIDIIKNLTPIIKDKDLQGSVIPMDSTPQIYQAYQDSSIYACSSRFEGFGMTLIEAMSCGVPCVSFDCPYGPRNITTNGKNGYLVEPNNIEALAERICHLIEHEELRKEMGKEARKRAEDFTEEKIMKQWIDLFENIS